ncbi:MAG: V-type ATP synthase subunit A [Candidatus Aceula meridiana]|nr:V-type ATP synthase subunit A [Candidatus Aceula meridiana]
MADHLRKGKVIGVNGNMVSVEFETNVIQNEVAYIVQDKDRLKSEVIRIRGRRAELQVYEDTDGVRVGDDVEFSGELLSVELGPGLLGQVFDGLQNPLPRLAEAHGFFLKRGVYLNALEEEQKWEFTPTVNVGDKLRAGMRVGFVPEKIFEHNIMVPFNIAKEVEVLEVVEKGKYDLKQVIAKVKDANGKTHMLTMKVTWPVKVPIKAYIKKIKPEKPLVTKIRIIDTLVPVAIGGTFCTPGPFGAGKTVLQHLLSRHADVDIVVIAACGERAGEVVEVLKTFPELIDPKTKKTLMDRTIIICNTSSMPVAARESSVYTAVTIAEYYRQMGLNVFLLADSTSRWAQAMREMSGRLEEIPGEEAFPAYLESRIASFYERAGIVQLRDGKVGSVTIGGAVSPAGGNFEEPVTQSTLKVVGAFHGLSRDRANARRYPAIDPLQSWSKYESFIDAEALKSATAILKRSDEINQMMKVVGEDGTGIEDFIDYLKGEFFDAVYLQQNAFDKIDEATIAERQTYVFNLISDIIKSKFQIESKDEARKFFLELRQKFINWNTLEFQADDFKKIEQDILEQIKSKKAV